MFIEYQTIFVLSIFLGGGGGLGGGYCTILLVTLLLMILQHSRRMYARSADLSFKILAYDISVTLYSASGLSLSFSSLYASSFGCA